MVQPTSAVTWLRSVTAQQPELTAIVVLFLGLFLAVLLSRLVRVSLEAFARKSRDEAQHGSFVHSRQQSAPRVTFWVVTLAALILALALLDVDSLSNWRKSAAEFGASSLLGIIVLVLGVGVATLAKDTLEGVNDSREMVLFASLVRYLILALAIITAFGQVGVDVMLVTTAATALITVIAATLGLSFALGSKDYLQNLMARNELNNLNIGDHLSVRDVEGVVTQIRKVSVELATDRGACTVPASWLLSFGYTKLADSNDE